MEPKSTQNHSKIHPKSIKNPPKFGSWGVLWSSWRRLGRILTPRARKSPKKPLVGPPRPLQVAPKIHQKLIKIRSGGIPKSDNFFDWLCGRVLVPFGANLVPTWPPKPSPNRPKLLPKSIKKGIKMLTKFLLHFSLV